MFIQTEATPNPATLKFVPGKTVLAAGTRDFSNAGEADSSPLATRLFQIQGVEGVFFGADFLAVTKAESNEWQHVKPAILGVIMEHFMSGLPVMEEDGANAQDSGEAYDDDDLEIVETIKELLDTRVRPAVAQDGGDITFQSYQSGVVYLHMKGACSGCPSSTATLKHGIENLLRHFIPEVEEVRPV